LWFCRIAQCTMDACYGAVLMSQGMISCCSPCQGGNKDRLCLQLNLCERECLIGYCAQYSSQPQRLWCVCAWVECVSWAHCSCLLCSYCAGGPHTGCHAWHLLKLDAVMQLQGTVHAEEAAIIFVNAKLRCAHAASARPAHILWVVCKTSPMSV
jgi:hypothetical protein